MTPPAPLPQAWLGLASTAEPIARVCAWCPDKAQADALAEARGFAVTHVACPACAAKLMREIEENTLPETQR